MIPSMKKAILFFLVLLPFRVFAQGDPDFVTQKCPFCN